MSIYDNNTYKVKVLKVYDGDTFTGEADLGFRVKIVQSFRLEGLDTPEINGKDKQDALDAKVFSSYYLNNAKEVLVRTKKTEKYGRYVATVFCDGVNLNEELIKEGYAKKVDY